MTDKIRLGDLAKSALFADKAKTGTVTHRSFPDRRERVARAIASVVSSQGQLESPWTKWVAEADAAIHALEDDCPTIKIHVSGGVVSAVMSDGPAVVELYDFDNLEDGQGEDDCSPAVHSFGEGGKEL